MGDRRKRRRKHPHRRKTVLLSAALALLAAAGLVLAVRQIRSDQEKYHVTAGNSVNMASGYRNISYQGKSYRYNALITTVLYAGVDSYGEFEGGAGYGSSPRADSVALAVLDKKHGKMTVIALSRDTMTEIHRYSLDGRDLGTYVSHLGYAFSYGDGGEGSCQNLVEAVSGLLGGIPINEYVVTNMSSMPCINRLAGGVTVTVPNGDIAALHPELQEGATVTLDDSNVTDYLHYRNTEADFSNEGRLERQRAFIDAFVETLRGRLQSEPGTVWEQIEEMDSYMLTSITKNKYLDLVNLSQAVEYSHDCYYRPEGENAAGSLHDEFHVDRNALMEKVVELFYEEI